MEEKILDICPQFPIDKLSVELLNHLPLDNDLIKGFNSNYKHYEQLKQILQPIYEATFFDACHLLGLFNKNGTDLEFVENGIKYLYLFYTPNEITYLLRSLSPVTYNEKYAKVLLNVILSEELHDCLDFFIYLYKHFNRISKEIKKINDNRLKNLKIDLGRRSDYLVIENQIEQIKKIGKNLTITDILDYRDKMVILDKNPILKPVADILRLETFSKQELEQLIQFYKYSLTSADNDEMFFTNHQYKTINNYKIQWLSSVDPNNLILGYLLKVCSTFSGSGSKVMIDGILNPMVKHVVISNPQNKIIGKATCLYNSDEQYIFCNAISFVDKFMDKDLTAEIEKELYHGYLKIIVDQVNSMKSKNIPLTQVRVADAPSFLLDCLSYEEQKELVAILSMFSYYHVESEEDLFNHKEASYTQEKQKYLV